MALKRFTEPQLVLYNPNLDKRNLVFLYQNLSLASTTHRKMYPLWGRRAPLIPPVIKKNSHDGANMLRNTKRSRILPDLHEMIDYVMTKAKKEQSNKFTYCQTTKRHHEPDTCKSNRSIRYTIQLDHSNQVGFKSLTFNSILIRQVLYPSFCMSRSICLYFPSNISSNRFLSAIFCLAIMPSISSWV